MKKRVKSGIAYLAATVLLAASFLQLDYLRPRAETPDFEVFQTYETPEEQANTRENADAGMSDCPGVLGIVSGTNALSGGHSMAVVPGYTSAAWEKDCINLADTAPAPAIDGFTGVFFRYRTTYSGAEPLVRVLLSQTQADGWGTTAADASGELIQVSPDGTVFKGKLQAGFDGYIFIELADGLRNTLQAGGAPFGLMLYGGENSFCGTQNWFDNVGYYRADGAGSDGYASLAAAIREAYPDNEAFEAAPANFQIAQDFENGEDGTFGGDYYSNLGDTTALGLVAGEDALNGGGSLKVSMGDIAPGNWAGVVLAQPAPANLVPNVNGFFMRVKTTAEVDVGQSIHLLLGVPDSDAFWSEAIGTDYNIWNAPADGSGAQKLNKIPAGYEGLLFVTFEEDQAKKALLTSLLNGTRNLGLRLTPEFSQSDLIIDDVGYFSVGRQNAEYYTLLAANIDDWAARTKPKNYQIFQTYNTADERENAGVNEAISNMGGAVSAFPGGGNAVAGSASFAVVPGYIAQGHEYVAVSLAKQAAAAHFTMPTGLVLRLKTDYQSGANLRLLVEDSADLRWGDNAQECTNDLIYVAMDGTVTKGAAMPAGFDGYAFIPVAEALMNRLKDGGKPVNLLLYGDNGSGTWSGTQTYFDNLGYYLLSAGTDEEYAAVAAAIGKEYPDNAGFAGAPVNLQMAQAFENGEDGSYDPDYYRNQGDTRYTLLDRANALQGKGSLKIEPSNVNASDWTGAALAKPSPSPVLPSVSGVFLRLKTDMPAGFDKGMYLLLGEAGDDGFWDDAVSMDGAMWYVPADGTVANKGALPARFDGYVFLPIDAAKAALLGARNLGIRMTGAFNGKTLTVDNVGYYVLSKQDDDNVELLARQLKSLYPEKAPTPGELVPFEMIQTYETEEARANSGVNEPATNLSGASGSAHAVTDHLAMSGGQSALVSVGNMANGWERLIYDFVKVGPKPSNPDTTGIFFRLKANNGEGAQLLLSLCPEERKDPAWGVNAADRAGELYLVTKDGAVMQGDLPADFDGYVFVPVPTDDINKKLRAAFMAGGAPVGVMLSGGSDAKSWAGVNAYVDNIGYYAMESTADADFIALVNSIREEYPENGSFNPNPPKAFQVVQTYENGDDGSFGYNYLYGNGVTGTSCKLTAGSGDALSGNASLVVQPKVQNLTSDWLNLALIRAPGNLAVDPALTPSGIFFRFQGDNPAGMTTLAMFVDGTGDELNNPWPQASSGEGKMIFVSSDGLITTGNFPAMFDGYVFLPLENNVMPYLGKKPISLYLGTNSGRFSTWSNTTALFDNVGYYSIKAGAVNDDYQALADAIKGEYPDNSVPSQIQFKLGDDEATSNSATVDVRREQTLHAIVDEGVANKEIAWSVAAGEDIVNIASTVNDGAAQSATLQFSGSGTAAITATLKADPTQKRVYAFSVIDPRALMEDVEAAKKLKKTDQTHANDGPWDNLQTTIGKCEETLNAVSTSQSELDTVRKELMRMRYYFLAKDAAGAYELFQKYESEAEQKNWKAPNDEVKLGGGTASVNLLTGPAALNGRSSLAIRPSTNGQYDWTSVPVAASIPAPSGEMPRISGIFLRIKADNMEGATLIMSFIEAKNEQEQFLSMADNSGTLFYVSADGSEAVYGDLPENANGYVFLPINEDVLINILSGSSPLSIYFGPFGNNAFGQRPSWGNVLVYLDNIGYYSVPEKPATITDEYLENFKNLAKTVAEKEPNNEIPKLYISTEFDPMPAEKMDVSYDLKPMLSAVVEDGVKNKTIHWEVIEGEATIENLDTGTAGQIALRAVHSCYVSFKNSGKVVVRARLAGEPATYVDFTMNVFPSTTELYELLLKARDVSGEFSAEDWNAFQAVVAQAEELLGKENIRQSEYNAMADKLREAFKLLGIIVDEETVNTLTSLYVDGYLTGETGDILTGYTLDFAGAGTVRTNEKGYYACKAVPFGEVNLLVKNAAGAKAAEKAFQLVKGARLRMDGDVVEVPNECNGITLSFSLENGSLILSQLLENNYVDDSWGDPALMNEAGANGDGGGGHNPATGVDRPWPLTVLIVLTGGTAALTAGPLKRRKRASKR